MKRLLIWITTLTLLFSALIALAGAVGRTAPPPEFAKWFTYPDGSPCPMPCLFGIRPGVTNFDDVKTILQSHPVLSDLKPGDEGDSHIYYFQSQRARLLVAKNDEGKVPYLIVGLQPFLDFKQILLTFGYPQGVSLVQYNYNDTTELSYQNNTVLMTIRDDPPACYFKPSTMISSITVEALGTYEAEMASVRGANMIVFYKWIGLSRYDYWNRYYYPISGAPFYGCSP